MLPIERISHNATHGDLWLKERKGKITASLFHTLISEKSHEGKFTVGAITYLDSLAGEIVTGEIEPKEFSTKHTEYGLATEPESIEYFLKETGLFALRNERINDAGQRIQTDTHRLIIDDEYSGCTPDILVSNESDINKLFNIEGSAIKVFPCEGKCPPKYHRFIKLFKCKTIADLKKTAPEYHYQVCKQMHSCNSFEGFFYAYHPKFPIKMRIIEYKKSLIKEDLEKTIATLYYAKEHIKNTIENLRNLK